MNEKMLTEQRVSYRGYDMIEVEVHSDGCGQHVNKNVVVVEIRAKNIGEFQVYTATRQNMDSLSLLYHH